MADAVPDTFEGKPTKYNLFDGFRRAETPMKVLYIAGAFATGLIVPIVIELMTNAEASKNRIKAENYYKQHPEENPVIQNGSPEKGLGPDLNPGAPQDGRVVAALQSRNAQSPAHQR